MGSRMVGLCLNWLMRERILDSDTPARKAWIGAIIDRIKVDHDTDRLFGGKDFMEHAVTSGERNSGKTSGDQGRWMSSSSFGTLAAPGTPR